MNDSPSQEADGMPKGIRSAYSFSVFNALSFSVILGTPMLLYFQKIEASAAVLSIVASMVQFLNIFQIPAARYVELIGYKKFVLRGWSTRVVFTLFMVFIVLLPPAVNNSTRMCLMLMLLFCFNTSRGISACGFLPWLTRLVPEQVRGRYVATDMLCVNIATVTSALVCTIYLNYFEKAWQFAPIIFAGFAFGAISLVFLKRIPDVSVPESSKSTEPVPWKRIITYKPFSKILILGFICNSTFAAAGVFYIPFLKAHHAASDSKILIMTVISGSVACLSFLSFGKMLDRVGNKPFIAISTIIWILHFLGWGLVAGGVIPFNWTVIFIQSLTAGIAGSWYAMSTTRLAMATVPEMGRSHFFAVLSVANSLTLGIVPVIWGIAIDSLGTWSATTYFWEWNRYSLMYIMISITMAGALIYQRYLDDAKSMTTEEFMDELFIKTPSRAIGRLWTRRPFRPFP